MFKSSLVTLQSIYFTKIVPLEMQATKFVGPALVEKPEVIFFALMFELMKTPEAILSFKATQNNEKDGQEQNRSL